MLIALLITGIVTTLNQPQSHVLVFNTTTYDEVKKMDGRTVSFTGYFSIASPEDQNVGYMIAKPLSGYPTDRNDTDTIGKVIHCYPAIGQKLIYSEKCVRVTGTLVYEELTDYCGLTYPYYLKDCTYVEVEPNDAIVNFNRELTNGAIKELNSTITELRNVISGESTTKFDTEAKQLKFLEVTYGVSDEAFLAFGKKVVELCELANAYLDAEIPEDGTVSDEYTALSEANSELYTLMNNWLNSLEVRGDE